MSVHLCDHVLCVCAMGVCGLFVWVNHSERERESSVARKRRVCDLKVVSSGRKQDEEEATK